MQWRICVVVRLWSYSTDPRVKVCKVQNIPECVSGHTKRMMTSISVCLESSSLYSFFMFKIITLVILFLSCFILLDVSVRYAYCANNVFIFFCRSENSPLSEWCPRDSGVGEPIRGNHSFRGESNPRQPNNPKVSDHLICTRTQVFHIYVQWEVSVLYGLFSFFFQQNCSI